MNAAAKLSAQEVHILLWLAERHPLVHPLNAAWGVRWRVGDATASVRASLSRSLRRLELRGLVLRQDDWSGNPETGKARQTAAEPHQRTTHVQLLPAGIEMAERLTNRGAEFVNRPAGGAA